MEFLSHAGRPARTALDGKRLTARLAVEKHPTMWMVLHFLAALALIRGAGADRPLVKTSLGELEGVWQTSAKGLQYAAFMGIPYAQSPVGDLRFEVRKDVKYNFKLVFFLMLALIRIG